MILDLNFHQTTKLGLALICSYIIVATLTASPSFRSRNCCSYQVHFQDVDPSSGDRKDGIWRDSKRWIYHYIPMRCWKPGFQITNLKNLGCKKKPSVFMVLVGQGIDDKIMIHYYY